MIRLFIKEKRRVPAAVAGGANNELAGSAGSTCGAAAPLSVRVGVMLYLSTFTIQNTASKFQLPT